MSAIAIHLNIAMSRQETSPSYERKPSPSRERQDWADVAQSSGEEPQNEYTEKIDRLLRKSRGGSREARRRMLQQRKLESGELSIENLPCLLYTSDAADE